MEGATNDAAVTGGTPANTDAYSFYVNCILWITLLSKSHKIKRIMLCESYENNTDLY